MTSAQLLAAFYRHWRESSSNATISDTDAYLYLSEAQAYICLEKQQNLAEEPLELVAGTWEYSLPTPSASLSNPAGADSYVAVESIRWLVTASLNHTPVLDHADYEYIVRQVYGSIGGQLASNYGYSCWANHPNKATFALYPIPDTSYAAVVSPMIVTYRAIPKAISGSQTTVFLKPDFHDAMALYASALAMIDAKDDRGLEKRDTALKLIDSIRAGRSRSLSGTPQYVSNKWAFKVPK